MAFDNILHRAKANPARIVLPEGHDPRIITAARHAADDGLALPILLGDPDAIRSNASALNLSVEDLELIDPAAHAAREPLTQQLHKLRAKKGMTAQQAATALTDNLHYACMMVRSGFADGCVAGAVYRTATVVRTALQLVGKHPDASFVSSFFFMLMTQSFHPIKGMLAFADCALVINPDAGELAEIAVMTGESIRQLLGDEPEIAMLSFSTAGSARHQSVSKVTRATALAKEKRPDWRIIGEVQLDAAVIPAILSAKAPDMASDRAPNILVFPTLDAGNIGYKMCERFGNAEAIGPVLQGLAKPVNDLSRGCKSDDIYNIIAVTVVQSHAKTVA